jgi:hypothetical protein
MTKDILFIADVKNSAIATSSRQWKNIIGGEVIYCADFISPIHLLKSIGRKNPNTILFTWRGGLTEILKDPKSTKYLQKTLINSRILFSVPDYVGLRLTSVEEQLLKFADGVTVVSEKLLNLYSNLRQNEDLPYFILRDLPDLNLINEINLRIQNRKNQVIWVGNSKWGERLGYSDHKGFKRFIQPIFAKLSKLDPNLETISIDRGKKFVPLERALEDIRSSKFLLQFSDSEGTGLPIIEACGLGTIPITRDIGVAKELLQGSLQNLVVTTADEAVERISELKDIEMHDALINSYNRYIKRCKESIRLINLDCVPIRVTNRRNYLVKKNLKNYFLVRFKWIYRNFKN